MTDVYEVIPYPDSAYQADEPAQSEARNFAQRKDRNLIRIFGIMAVAFALAIGFGFARLGIAILACLVAFIVLFVVGIVVLCTLPTGRVCGKCGGKLETVWPVTFGGFAAEYRICRQCKLFRYMFRTSRR